MKFFVFLLCLVSFSMFGQSEIQGLFVEEYYRLNKNDLSALNLSGPIDENSITYRIYLDLSPGCRFQAESRL
ncbi:MAG: hypothetical protein ACKO8Q_08055 [Bacteroidota bacterium]